MPSGLKYLENISKNQRSKKFLRLRIVTKLERTAIDGVESGISSRIVKSNAPRKESRNRALPFCNSPLIRVENCLQLFGWIRFHRWTGGNRRKWEYRAPRFFALGTNGSTTGGITEETSLRFSHNINICGEAVKVTWNFYRLRSMMLL